MKEILLVDDSKFIQAIVKNSLSEIKEANITSSYTLQTTQKLLNENHYDIAIVDVNLPDAPSGEAIALTINHNIPVIVLTAGMNDVLKDIILKENIVEYITKSDPNTVTYITTVVQRVLNNMHTTVMVVDDSNSTRLLMKTYLEKLKINIIESSNAIDALELMEKYKSEISLVITDNKMPKMDGMEFVSKLREKYSKDQLAIIAISGGEQTVSNDFLRHGANDFIKKPFTYEEFSSRVNLNLELIDLFKQIKDSANKDFLTGMYNRRFFFEASKTSIAKAKRNSSKLAVVMLDIDNFKKINDNYGHNIGDIAIKEVANVLEKTLRESDLTSRFGGEEFCILLEDIELKDLYNRMENIRGTFEKNVIEVNDIKFSYTVSIGAYYGLYDSMADMLNMADECLYEAKNSGRNKVIIRQ